MINNARKCKPKPCSECKEVFQPRNSLTVVCGYRCAGERVKRINAKKAASASKKAERASKRDIKARKVALKTKSQWKADVQNNAFNPFIRWRDRDEPCISCGRFDHEIEDKFIGGKWDCGHYLTRGAYPELRFEELNAHKQCKSCNGGSGKYVRKNRTVQQNYRVNLIKKIGLKQVLWIEGKHEPKKHQIDELIEMKAYYKTLIKII